MHSPRSSKRSSTTRIGATQSAVPGGAEKAFDAFVLATTSRSRRRPANRNAPKHLPGVPPGFPRAFKKSRAAILKKHLARDVSALVVITRRLTLGIPLVAETRRRSLAACAGWLTGTVAAGHASVRLPRSLQDLEPRCFSRSDSHYRKLHVSSCHLRRANTRILAGVCESRATASEDEKPLERFEGRLWLASGGCLPISHQTRIFVELIQARHLCGLRSLSAICLIVSKTTAARSPRTRARIRSSILCNKMGVPPEAWQTMLGPDWKKLHPLWLHRLGNLTLTGYNSTYSDRSFEEKESIPCGFAESSVRLNKWVREQAQSDPGGNRTTR